MSQDMKQILTAGPGLLIGIPTLGRPVPLDWAMNYRGLNPPINFSTNVLLIQGKPVAQAREEVCENAIKMGHKYVFFLGDDVIPPMSALKQLIFRAEQDKSLGVVGGIYCSKSEPPAPLVFRGNGKGTYWDWKVGEFFEVTGLGMDCTLIKTEVLSKISKPWFKTVDDDDFLDAINNAEQWTEDLYFCKKLITETDYTIWCDSTILCRHVDVYSGKTYSLPSESIPTSKLNTSKKKLALDIGCGPINRKDEFPDFELIRADIREEVNPDYRCDVRSLPFDNSSFDLVFSSHVLEHFNRDEWVGILNEWVRVLKPTGEIVLILPNIKWAAREILKDKHNERDVLNVFYGAQSNPFDFHYNGLWPERIKQELEKLKFNNFSFDEHGYNMIIRANRGAKLAVKVKKKKKGK